MAIRRKKRTPRVISMAPMIDVVFLLLLFFMVTTTFNKQTEVKIKLPEAAGEQAEAPPKSVTLVIDADGVYFVKGTDGMLHQLVDQKPETLKRELTKMAAGAADVPFIISADGKTPHQAVISALDAAGGAGFTHITFEAQQPKTVQ